MEVISAAERVVGKPIPRVTEARRPGDPPALVADPKKIKTQLGWKPSYNSIDSVVETA